eukprot:1831467-Rhodomonas_salina.3
MQSATVGSAGIPSNVADIARMAGIDPHSKSFQLSFKIETKVQEIKTARETYCTSLEKLRKTFSLSKHQAADMQQWDEKVKKLKRTFYKSISTIRRELEELRRERELAEDNDANNIRLPTTPCMPTSQAAENWTDTEIDIDTVDIEIVLPKQTTLNPVPTSNQNPVTVKYPYKTTSSAVPPHDNNTVLGLSSLRTMTQFRKMNLSHNTHVTPQRPSQATETAENIIKNPFLSTVP